MKRYMWVIVAMVLICGGSMSMGQSYPLKKIAKFPGASLKWIRLAEPEFERHKLDLDKYNVEVIEESDSITVFLSSTDAPEGSRGSGGKYPGYQVEFSKKDMKILHSNYTR
jgi:hypothetical protein